MSSNSDACLSAREHVNRTTGAIYTNFCACCVAYRCGSVLLQRCDEIPREGAILRVIFPIDNELYSIAFETHTKTAELIECRLR